MIFDGLIRIQNGYSVGHRSVDVCASRFMRNILLLLREEGLIQGFSTFYGDRIIRVFLNSAIVFRVKFISKSGCRKFISYRGVCKKHVSGRYVTVVSTSQGLFTSKFITLNKLGIGGELLFNLYVDSRC